MQLSSRIAERVAAFLGLLISDFRLMSALKNDVMLKVINVEHAFLLSIGVKLYFSALKR